jgi:hypothetical protein
MFCGFIGVTALTAEAALPQASVLGCTYGSIRAEIGEKKYSTSSSRCHLRWGKSASIKPVSLSRPFVTIPEKFLFKRAIHIDERKEKAQR